MDPWFTLSPQNSKNVISLGCTRSLRPLSHSCYLSDLWRVSDVETLFICHGSQQERFSGVFRQSSFRVQSSQFLLSHFDVCCVPLFWFRPYSIFCTSRGSMFMACHLWSSNHHNPIDNSKRRRCNRLIQAFNKFRGRFCPLPVSLHRLSFG